MKRSQFVRAVGLSGWLVAGTLLVTRCDNTTQESLGALDAKRIAVRGDGPGSVVIADGVITITDDHGHKARFDAQGAHVEGAAPVPSATSAR